MDQHYKQFQTLLPGLLVFTQPVIKDYGFALLILITSLVLFIKNNTTAKQFQRSFNISISLFVMVLLKIVLNNYGYTFDFYVIGAAAAIITIAGPLTQIQLHYLSNNKNNTFDTYFLTEKTAKPTLLYLFNGTIIASLTCLILTGNTIEFRSMLFLSMIGSLTAALLSVIPSTHKDFTTIIGTAMAIWLFANIGYTAQPAQLILAIAIALLLSYAAYKKDVADISAMIAATLIGVIIITFTNLLWFAPLIAFFSVGGGFTKYKYEYKKARGIAEKKGGVRSYTNVFSNSLPALSLAISYQAFPAYHDIILIAYLASLSTALGDTLASEIGQTSKSQPRMITTLKKTTAGTDGGITLTGECASITGAFIIAMIAAITQLIPFHPTSILVITFAGLLGTNIDSFLGATLQQKKLLSNNGVNLASTSASAVIIAICITL